MHFFWDTTVCIKVIATLILKLDAFTCLVMPVCRKCFFPYSSISSDSLVAQLVDVSNFMEPSTSQMNYEGVLSLSIPTPVVASDT